MSRKTNPVLDDLNIYLVIDSRKAENKFEDIVMIHKNGHTSQYDTNNV